MGLVSLMDKAAKGETSNVYEFTMTGKADELVGKIANGDLDIAWYRPMWPASFTTRPREM